MNKDIIKESLIYDELGLSPIWVTLPKTVEVKKEQLSTKGNIFNLKKIELDDLNVLFVAPIFNSSDTIELELFKKISAYLDTLSDKLRQLQPIKMAQESELASEMELCDYLILLEQGLDSAIEKENLTIPYISSVSLKEMVENPEKKRKLWQDIKKLIKSIKQ
jgi:DNA polymerase III psi subunit